MSEKNNVVAALLALFLGGFGAQHFYLGNTKWGIIYLAACWGGAIIGGVGSIFCIPAILLVLPLAVGVLSIVETVMYFVMPPETFQAKITAGQTSVLNGLMSKD